LHKIPAKLGNPSIFWPSCFVAAAIALNNPGDGFHALRAAEIARQPQPPAKEARREFFGRESREAVPICGTDEKSFE
jgi:hypothetical protein